MKNISMDSSAELFCWTDQQLQGWALLALLQLVSDTLTVIICETIFEVLARWCQLWNREPTSGNAEVKAWLPFVNCLSIHIILAALINDNRLFYNTTVWDVTVLCFLCLKMIFVLCRGFFALMSLNLKLQKFNWICLVFQSRSAFEFLVQIFSP